MSRELERLLHRTAVEPERELDARRVVARGRRRRRTRHAGAAAGSLAVVLLAVGVVVGGLTPRPEPEPPVIGERPDPSQPPRDEDGPDGPEGAGEGEGDASAEPGDDEIARIAPRDAGHRLLLADDRGVRRVDDAGERQLADNPAALALPDGDGGVVVQGPDGGAIRRLTADDGEPPPLASPEQQPTLHAVVEHDGRPTVLLTRRGGQGDAETETLHAHRLDDATEEDLGSTGGVESGISGVTLADGDLLLSRCHLECDLVRVPWGADPDGEQALELHDRALPIHGLDGHATTAAYVHFPLHVPDLDDEAGDDGARPQLWLHDVADDTRDEIVLPPPEDLDAPTISVDVAADGTAALVVFHSPGQGTAQTLLVDRLDQQPRRRWLDTTAHVRLDAAP